MARYIVQMRRGNAAQWAEKNTLKPMEGEIVIEIDEENSFHKLKIGDGVHTYDQLAYLMAGDEIITQVLSKTLPRVVTVELTTNWTQDTNGRYSQVIALDNITNCSRLDLQPDADMLAEFKQLNLIFTTENNNGSITVYSIGDMPLKSYTMQATIIETDADCEKIIGTPVCAPMAQSDWNQTDETKVDYIKNKPDVTNALVGKSRGVSVDLTDISPLEHEIKVKISTELENVGQITNMDNAEWSKALEYDDYVVESFEDGNMGEGRINFTDGSWLDIGMCVNVMLDEVNVGDIIRFDYNREFEDEEYWYAYLMKGFTGDPTTVKVTVSNVYDLMYLTDTGMAYSFTAGEGVHTITDIEVFPNDSDSVKLTFEDGTYIDFAHYDYIDDNYSIVKIEDKISIKYSYNEDNNNILTAYLIKGEYKEPINYTPNADGTVIGIIGDGTPIAISNDKGAILEVEYNRDLNKVIEALTNAIIALGGTI